MSAKIITIAIEKGGTGKTVTASNLAYLMGEMCIRDRLWTSLEHLCITLYTYRIYYSTISSLYFICNGFSHFYYLLSQLFLFFKFYFLLYIYILWFYILLSLRCFGSAFLYMAVFFSFLSHF